MKIIKKGYSLVILLMASMIFFSNTAANSSLISKDSLRVPIGNYERIKNELLENTNIKLGEVLKIAEKAETTLLEQYEQDSMPHAFFMFYPETLINELMEYIDFDAYSNDRPPDPRLTTPIAEYIFKLFVYMTHSDYGSHAEQVKNVNDAYSKALKYYVTKSTGTANADMEDLRTVFSVARRGIKEAIMKKGIADKYGKNFETLKSVTSYYFEQMTAIEKLCDSLNNSFGDEVAEIKEGINPLLSEAAIQIYDIIYPGLLVGREGGLAKLTQDEKNKTAISYMKPIVEAFFETLGRIPSIDEVREILARRMSNSNLSAVNMARQLAVEL
jgi:hypothetical protein